MERSLDSLAGMAAYAFGTGSYAAMRQAISPKTFWITSLTFLPVGGYVGEMRNNIRS